MKPKIIFCLALVLIGGLSASGDCNELPVTPKSLDQGRFVFSISTSPAQEGMAFHVTITTKTGTIPSDCSVVVWPDFQTRSTHPHLQVHVTVEKTAQKWACVFIASAELLKDPDVCLVFEVPAHDDKGIPMPGGDFYEIKLRDFLKQ